LKLTLGRTPSAAINGETMAKQSAIASTHLHHPHRLLFISHPHRYVDVSHIQPLKIYMQILGQVPHSYKS
jgi:hypothetical protein